MANRSLESDELEDAKRLKQIWKNKKDDLNLSQVKAAKELGYSSQGAISQYLNGRVPLNIQAVAKFAKLLRVPVGEISPRYGKMVKDPIPQPLEPYTPAVTGSVGGVATDICLDWFAVHKEFARSVGVAPENLKFVRLEDGSFKDMPSGSVLLVDDSPQHKPTDGVYLMLLNGTIVARRIALGNNDDIQITGGHKKIHVDSGALGLLRVVARVLSVFTPVS